MAELDVDDLAKRVELIIRPMQQHFSFKPGAYYNHALFFLSMVLHRVLPVNIHRVIMLDADLKFSGDIRLLYDHFWDFGYAGQTSFSPGGTIMKWRYENTT